MARSKYIYTLYEDFQALAHFTVKHEAVAYWERKLNKNPAITMERSQDGGPVEKAVVIHDWQT